MKIIYTYLQWFSSNSKQDRSKQEAKADKDPQKNNESGAKEDDENGEEDGEEEEEEEE